MVEPTGRELNEEWATIELNTDRKTTARGETKEDFAFKSKPPSKKRSTLNTWIMSNNISNVSIINKPENQFNETARIARRNTSRIRKTLEIKTFLIFPDDWIKDIWGLVMTLMLLYSTIITPYKIAFFKEEPIGWFIADLIVDLFFTIDIVLQFFTAYFDDNQELVTDRKVIACHYLKTWFALDFVAIIPFNMFFNTEGNKDYSALARLSRLPRLYRLIKITKLLRTIRMIRDRKSVKQQNLNWFNLEKYIRMGVSAERLFTFTLIYLICCHVSACLFYLVAQLEGVYPDSWVLRNGLQDASNTELYTASFYYTITTITTVGYGDITPKTVVERWFSTFVLIFGVMSYSFAISSISSWLSSSDAQEAKEKHDMNTLDSIDLAYNLDSDIYMELKKLIVLRYRNEEHLQDHQMFSNKFPRKYKRELNAIMRTNDLMKINVFKRLDENFVKAAAKEIRILKKQRDEYIFKEGDEIDGIYFVAKGRAELVLTEFHNRPFVQITKGHVFGELDFLEDRATRNFTARVADDCELLQLKTGDLHSLMEKYSKEVMKFFSSSEYKLERVHEMRSWMAKKLFLRTQRLSKKLMMAISTAKSRHETKQTHELEDSSMDDSVSIYSDVSEESSKELTIDMNLSGTIKNNEDTPKTRPRGLSEVKPEQLKRRKDLHGADSLRNPGNGRRGSQVMLGEGMGEVPIKSKRRSSKVDANTNLNLDREGKMSEPKKTMKFNGKGQVVANLCGSLLLYNAQNNENVADSGHLDRWKHTKSYDTINVQAAALGSKEDKGDPLDTSNFQNKEAIERIVINIPSQKNDDDDGWGDV